MNRSERERVPEILMKEFGMLAYIRMAVSHFWNDSCVRSGSRPATNVRECISRDEEEGHDEEEKGNGPQRTVFYSLQPKIVSDSLCHFPSLPHVRIA